MFFKKLFSSAAVIELNKIDKKISENQKTLISLKKFARPSKNSVYDYRNPKRIKLLAG